MEGKCADCDHVGVNPDTSGRIIRQKAGKLICRRFPPSANTYRNIDDHRVYSISIWPEVTEEEGCGEFRLKPDDSSSLGPPLTWDELDRLNQG